MWGVLAGAALGALKAKKDDEDLLKGALLGGVLGGATAGLGNALGGATAATEGAGALAGAEGALSAATVPEGLLAGMQTSQAAQAASTDAGLAELASIVPERTGEEVFTPSRFDALKDNFSKGMSNVTTDKAGQFLQGQVQEEPQQQFQPVQVAPLQQAPVATAPSPVQQMAAGGQPTFVPKAMFEAEVGGRQEQMERERLLEMLRQRGMA